MTEGRIDYIITGEDGGKEVKQILRQGLKISASLLIKLKAHPRGITLNGRPVTVRERVEPGQILIILTEAAAPPNAVIPIEGRLDVIFEDSHMLVLNKPVGLPSHPSRGHYLDTLANRVVFYLGQQTPFRAINRLDRGTSGLICIAKNAFSAQALGAQSLKRQINRTYFALCQGTGLPQKATINAPIARVPGMGIKRQVDENGQNAITHFEKISEKNNNTLLKLTLETGRTHQIRVHLSHLGHPVIGDFMYGNALDFLDGHALHGGELTLFHPETGEKMAFFAPIPQHFDTILAQNDGQID